jgi:hypothetical protein
MSYAYLQVQTQIDTILTALHCVQAIILQAVEMLAVDDNKTLKQNKSWKKTTRQLGYIHTPQHRGKQMCKTVSEA